MSRGSARRPAPCVEIGQNPASRPWTGEALPRSLATALTVTDIAFLLYWTIAALSQSGLIEIPAEWMYANSTRCGSE